LFCVFLEVIPQETEQKESISTQTEAESLAAINAQGKLKTYLLIFIFIP
jgi:hypothetical protein